MGCPDTNALKNGNSGEKAGWSWAYGGHLGTEAGVLGSSPAVGMAQRAVLCLRMPQEGSRQHMSSETIKDESKVPPLEDRTGDGSMDGLSEQGPRHSHLHNAL